MKAAKQRWGTLILWLVRREILTPKEKQGMGPLRSRKM